MKCFQFHQFKTEWPEIYQALICGKKLDYTSPVKALFVKGGLIHIMVVSGAHLIFLEKLTASMLPSKKYQIINLILLMSYAFITGLQPPVLRAFMSYLLFHISYSKKLFWSPLLRTLLSAGLCLIYSPAWLHNLSFQLSVIAVLLQNIPRSQLSRSFFIYLFLLPILNRWQNLHPITVILNWILAPVIGAILFPITLATSLIRPLYMLTDELWYILIRVLDVFQFLIPEQNILSWSLPEQWTGAYILVLFATHSLIMGIQRSVKNK